MTNVPEDTFLFGSEAYDDRGIVHRFCYGATADPNGMEEWWASCSCTWRAPVSEPTKQYAWRDWDNHVKCLLYIQWRPTKEYMEEQAEYKRQFEAIKKKYQRNVAQLGSAHGSGP